MGHHYEEKLGDITVMVSKDGTRAAAEFNVSGKYLHTELGLPDAAGQTYNLPAGAFSCHPRWKDCPCHDDTSNLTDWIAQVAG